MGDFRLGEASLVPQRPGGGRAAPDSIETGLRELALRAGPDPVTLSQATSPGRRSIMDACRTPDSWDAEVKATAIIAVIIEVVNDLRNVRWRRAAEAALRVSGREFAGAENDSLAARFRTAARFDPSPEQDLKARSEAYRYFWMAAAKRLAVDLLVRIDELNESPERWNAYGAAKTAAGPRALPISFDRTDVLYRLDGMIGVQSISYRWLTAHDAVDHYDVVGHYYSDPDAPVEVRPLANCELDGPMVELPTGGRRGRLRFGRTLGPGEKHFFAYMTIFNSKRQCRPTILYDVRGQSMRDLTLRVQFDPTYPPRKAWAFDIGMQTDGLDVPGDGDPAVLKIGANGYADNEFPQCERGRKYGIRWMWEV